MKRKNYKANDNKNWLAFAITCFVILLALVYTVVSLVTGSWNPAGWAKKTPGEIVRPNPDDDNKPDDGNKPGDGDESGISLTSARISPDEYADYGIAPQAESAYTLTVQLTPEYADVPTIEWHVEWNSYDNEWSLGRTVTDYVTLTPLSEGSLTATVTCLQPFGTRIIVYANTDIDFFTSILLDYSKRVTFDKMSYEIIDSSGTISTVDEITFNISSEQNLDCDEISCKPQFTYSAGTITSFAEMPGAFFILSDELINYFHGIGSRQFGSYTVDYTTLIKPTEYGVGFVNIDTVTPINQFFGSILRLDIYDKPYNEQCFICNTIMEDFANYSGAVVDAVYEVYDDNTLEVILTGKIGINKGTVDYERMPVSLENISFPEDNIIF